MFNKENVSKKKKIFSCRYNLLYMYYVNDVY